MKTYIEFITEALNPTDYLPIQKKSVELFLGRMQPVHKAHLAIIKMMNNPIVALVKGAKTSLDKNKNPFDTDYQLELLKKLKTKAELIVVPTGYIPDIISLIRKEGKEVTAIYAGADRFKGYQGQIASFNKQMPEDKQITVTMKETPRVTSATIVRTAIIDDDIETFKKSMPKELWGEFDKMKDILK